MIILSVILPAYNEAENLKAILPQLKSALLKINVTSEILVVDTQEPTDETPMICKLENIKYIPRKGGNNYGDAIRTGFEKACGKYVVVMDADGSHSPDGIGVFYQEMISEQYDLIIGSRYCKGGYTDNPFILRLMSRMLNVTYRIVFGLSVKDVSDSFRMYKGEHIKTLTLECDNFDIVEEILIDLNYTVKNFRAKEVPISFNKRASGQSKRDLKKFIISYLQTMKRLIKIKRKNKKRTCA